MTTDFRALCARLADELDAYRKMLLDDRNVTHRLADEARAALAEREPKRRYIYNPVQIAECGGPCEQGPEHCDCGELWLAQPEPVAEESSVAQSTDGEVAELVAWLREQGQNRDALSLPGVKLLGQLRTAPFMLTRAASLMERLERYEQALSAVMPPDFKDWWENSKDEWPDVAAGVIENLRKREELALEQVGRLSPPQPVPVSERLPGSGDCDAEGRCWLCGKVEGDWRLINPEKSGVPQLKYCFSHWLPAHALPLPQ